jgi:hypothetical protein
MKIKTSTLIGPALDWAVAIAKGIKPSDIRVTRERLYRWHRNAEGEKTGSYQTGPELLFSTMWEAGGPIIDRMMRGGLRLSGYTCLPTDPTHCQAQLGGAVAGGPTALVAAMRCFVTSKLGDEVDIPEELL